VTGCYEAWELADDAVRKRNAELIRLREKLATARWALLAWQRVPDAVNQGPRDASKRGWVIPWGDAVATAASNTINALVAINNETLERGERKGWWVMLNERGEAHSWSSGGVDDLAEDVPPGWRVVRVTEVP